jgi:hypothetical protein
MRKVFDRSFRRGAVLVVVALASALSACGAGTGAAKSVSPGRAYLAHLGEQVALLKKQVPHVADVAEASADNFIKTETLALGPVQISFTRELNGRAGGLPDTAWLGSRKEPAADAVVAVAYAPRTVSNDDRMAQYARSRGYRVLFASPKQVRELADRTGEKFRAEDFSAVIDNHVGDQPFRFQGGAVPTASLLNVANGWVYVGELAAASTRRGKMPVFYLSFGVDGENDYRRARKYTVKFYPDKPYGKMRAFHNDVIVGKDAKPGVGQMVVPPLEPGVLGRRYLDELERYLAMYSGDRFGDLEQIVKRAEAAKRAGHKVYLTAVGHTFPHQVPDDELSGVINVITPRWNRKGYEAPAFAKGDLLIVLGMPQYPAGIVRGAQERGLDVVVTSRQEPGDVKPDERNTERFLWIEAPWPAGDGAVSIPGYDIKVLPVTGFMNGAFYYALRAELAARLGEPAVPGPKQPAE